MCGACVEACPNSCHVITTTDSDEDSQSASIGEKMHRIDRSKCTACGECVDVCLSRAVQIKGEWMDVDEVVFRAERMKPFFQHSRGGVTLTGGEVCRQPEFACAILEGCTRLGIHTAIETSGFAAPDALERIAGRTDLILFDLKLIDEEAHRAHTGGTNRTIVENLRRLPADRVIVRVPLIPRITDTEENIRGIVDLAASLGIEHVHLLPYNAAAGAKYQWVGRPYPIEEAEQTRDDLDRLVGIAKESRVTASVEA